MLILVNRKTGKIHTGPSTNSPMCNQCGNKRIPSMVVPSASFVAAAPAEAFCKKCFPEGKPV
jgi:hypothetical protein